MPKVLIVDDDADVREGLLDALESHGLSCWAVQDGQEALDCLRVTEVDLIVTDYRMPAMDGLDLLRRLSDSALGNIPIILLSAESAADLRQEALRLEPPPSCRNRLTCEISSISCFACSIETAAILSRRSPPPNQGGNYERKAGQ